MAGLLKDACTAIAPHIKAVLDCRDGQWKYGVLIELGRSVSLDVWSLIEVNVMRLMNAPTKRDILDEVHTLALEIFETRPAARESAPKEDW